MSAIPEPPPNLLARLQNSAGLPGDVEAYIVYSTTLMLAGIRTTDHHRYRMGVLARSNPHLTWPPTPEP